MPRTNYTSNRLSFSSLIRIYEIDHVDNLPKRLDFLRNRANIIFSALVDAGFGSTHYAAWLFELPSPVEQPLCRAASLTEFA